MAVINNSMVGWTCLTWHWWCWTCYDRCVVSEYSWSNWKANCDCDELLPWWTPSAQGLLVMDGYCKVAGHASGTRSAPGATLHHRTLSGPLTKHYCRALSLNRLSFRGGCWSVPCLIFMGKDSALPHSTVASAGSLGWILHSSKDILQNGQFAVDTLLTAALLSNDCIVSFMSCHSTFCSSCLSST